MNQKINCVEISFSLKSEVGGAYKYLNNLSSDIQEISHEQVFG